MDKKIYKCFEKRRKILHNLKQKANIILATYVELIEMKRMHWFHPIKKYKFENYTFFLECRRNDLIFLLDDTQKNRVQTKQYYYYSLFFSCEI